jgi:hypothetical protein
MEEIFLTYLIHEELWDTSLLFSFTNLNEAPPPLAFFQASQQW